jgi:hypothetical protein
MVNISLSLPTHLHLLFNIIWLCLQLLHCFKPNWYVSSKYMFRTAAASAYTEQNYTQLITVRGDLSSCCSSMYGSENALLGKRDDTYSVLSQRMSRPYINHCSRCRPRTRRNREYSDCNTDAKWSSSPDWHRHEAEYY